MLTTFNVTSAADLVAAAPFTPGTIRWAIDQANNTDGDDIINMSAGLPTIALGGGIGIGELPITDGVTINGNGDTIDAGGFSRIFGIDATAGDVTIRGLILKNGADTAGIGSGGGAIYSGTLGMLTITDSTITGSHAAGGAPGGGAIFTVGDLTVSNATIGGAGALGNTTTGNGGGIYAGGDLKLTNSVITGNHADTHGGGIYGLGKVTIQGSTIGGLTPADGNSAGGGGGGIFASNVTVQNSAIANNSSSGTDTGGGGIFASRTVVVQNSTVSGNTATGSGGGIYNQYNSGGIPATTVTLINATIANNEADSDMNATGIGGGIYTGSRLTVRNSIIIGNTDHGNGNPDLVKGLTNDIRFSLIGDDTGAVGVAGPPTPGPLFTPNSPNKNIVGTTGSPIDIKLVLDSTLAGVAILKDNNSGQPPTTPTIALSSPTSLAKDAGSNKLVVNGKLGDQRGLPFVRIRGASVDMGAFEDQPPIPADNPPVLDHAIPAQTAIVGTPFAFTFDANTFTDPDGDTLTYSATFTPSGASAWITTFPNGTTSRTFAGVPAATDVGSVTVHVTASDGKGGTKTTDFVITVVPAGVPGVALFSENFNGVVSPLLVTQTGTFVQTSNQHAGTRSAVGGTAIVTIPSLTTAILTPHYQVETKVTLTPNGHDLYQNGFIVFDYQSPTNFKYAGAFGLLDRFVIGQISGGKNTQLFSTRAPITAGVQFSLRLEINGLVATLFNGAAQVAQKAFTTSFTGSVGYGTINANSSFDDVTVTTL